MTKTHRKLRRRGEAMVQVVLAETLDQLGRVGLEGLSVAEVAGRAGVNKTSVYRRWPTKEALVQAALGAHLGAPPDFVPTGELEADLLTWVRASARFANSSLGRAALRSLLGSPHPKRGPLARRLRASVEGPRRLLEKARQRGALRRDVDLDLLLTTVAGAVLQRAVVEDRQLDDPFLSRLVELLLAGARGSVGGARATKRTS